VAGVTAGYWRNPELTAKTIKEGWFHTCDLACQDEAGVFWFVSRKSEIIRSRDGLVSPIEVEAALYRHPSVREAGVVGVPDHFGYERAQAQLVLHPGGTPVTEEQLIDFVRALLPDHKLPQEIIFTEELSFGPTGKIDRKTLRENAIARGNHLDAESLRNESPE
jgi:acyl-CoA synthetase (AMP-forming)/AMP-acid ligase II